jgi:hypothetical protein
MLVNSCQSTRRYNPEDSHRQEQIYFIYTVKNNVTIQTNLLTYINAEKSIIHYKMKTFTHEMYMLALLRTHNF